MLLNKCFRLIVLVLLLFVASWIGAQHKLKGVVKALVTNETLIGATIEE